MLALFLLNFYSLTLTQGDYIYITQLPSYMQMKVERIQMTGRITTLDMLIEDPDGKSCVTSKNGR